MTSNGDQPNGSNRPDRCLLALAALANLSSDYLAIISLTGRILCETRGFRELLGTELAASSCEPCLLDSEQLGMICNGESIDAVVARAPSRPYGSLAVHGEPVRDADGTIWAAACRLTLSLDAHNEADAQRRLAAIVESTTDAIISKDLDGTILTWNMAATHMYGYSAEEAIGQPISMLIPDTDDDDFDMIMNRLRQGKKVIAHRTRRMRKDGSIVHVSLTVAPLSNAHGDIVGASTIARDFTLQSRYEDHLKESASFARRVLDTLFPFVAVLDTNGRIVEVNTAVLGNGAVTRDLLTGRRIDQVYWFEHDPRERQKVTDAIAVASRGGEFRCDLLLQRYSGEFIEIDFGLRPMTDNAGKITHLIASAVDITDRKRAERELARMLERQNNIAATLQRSLLQMPPVDAFPGLEVATVYEAASNDLVVGGDFLDALPLAGQKVALVVGDVSGKGLAAAARTAEIKYVLRAFLREHASAANALSRLNVHLCEQVNYDPEARYGFVALSLVVVHATTGLCEVACAGIEPPVLAKSNGEYQLIGNCGMPLGVEADAPYSATEVTLALGDMLMMVTDGLTESRREKEMFGLDGLIRMLPVARCQASLVTSARTILEASRTFAGGVLKDDACVLLAQLSVPQNEPDSP